MMALSGASCFLTIAPALAQSGPQPSFQNRFGNLENRIQVGLLSGAITRTEAAPLRDELRLIQQLERRYSPGGFTQTERDRLQTRLQSLRQQIATAERNDYARPGTSATRISGPATRMIETQTTAATRLETSARVPTKPASAAVCLGISAGSLANCGTNFPRRYPLPIVSGTGAFTRSSGAPA
jgi:hypothetical protein